MEAKKLFSEVPCPSHPTYPIQGVNLQNHKEPKLFCFTCMLEQKDISVISNLKAFPDLIRVVAEASIKNKSSIQPQEKPKEYVTLLSLKDERIEQLCKHIEEEKLKVSTFFDTLISQVTEILLDKKKLHLDELDQQAEVLTRNFAFFEKELKKLYPSDEEHFNLFPTQESLEKRFHSITKASELMDFVKDLGSSSLEHEKCSNLGLMFEFQRTELPRFSKELLKDHVPAYQPESWKASEFIKEVKGRVGQYFDQTAHLKLPVQKLGYLDNFDSTVATIEEFHLLSSWLPENVKFNPTLLFRSSRDGRDAKTFHRLCDWKKNTVTLVKALFNDATEPCVIGGFLDGAWHNKDGWISSKNAFLFSLTSKTKCPILSGRYAAYGHPKVGPLFGFGNSLRISFGQDSNVYTPSESYKDIFKLVNRDFVPPTHNYFKEIEVEVFSFE